MGRFANLETFAAIGLCSAVAGVSARFLVQLGLGASIAAGLVAGIFAGLPLASWAQDRLVAFYAGRGWIDRALKLALAIRDSAPTREMRDLASIDVALVHLARADFEAALTNLRHILVSKLQPKTRGVVLGHTAYCLAHLGRDAESAVTQAEEAARAVPEEWVFGYFVGLCKLKAGRAAEAAKLIRDSLAADPDETLPLPGERSYALAEALFALGDEAEAGSALARAAAAPGRFGDLARKRAIPTPKPAEGA